MKRLKNKLLAMEPGTSTYVEMYEGSMQVCFPGGASPVTAYEAVYYRDNIGFHFERSHKLALDKPTITIRIPAEMLRVEAYNHTAADFCLRAFRPYIDELNAGLYNRSRPDNENGKYELYTPGGEVLVRNSSFFALCRQKDYENGAGSTVYALDGVTCAQRMCLCIRIQVQLPRQKLRKTIQMLCRDLPDATERFTAQFDCKKLRDAVMLGEKQAAIRKWLSVSSYCAFIANGSILPRAKGCDLPMKNAVPFRSTPEDEIEVCGIRGFGVRRGVTVITGGGYSGKTTLLDAISSGICDHVAGDGRELVLTDDTAVKITAEDGRSIRNVNISPFIKWIPGGDPLEFSTEWASGSTSQAAIIMEAINCGSRLLLIDEDRSATNFMIKDGLMKTLIAKEPITPFTDRVGELFRDNGVSTVLVIGGSGEYLSVADHVYIMDDFFINNITSRAKELCRAQYQPNAIPESVDWTHHRTLLSDRFSSYPEGKTTERLEMSDMGFILIGDECIDIRMLHHLDTQAQRTALGFMLRRLMLTNQSRRIDLRQRIDALYDEIEKEGLDCVFSNFLTTCERFLDLPRKIELYAAIHRMRNIKFIRD